MIVGIDIGTTNISGAIVDIESKKVIKSITESNKGDMKASCEHQRLQNPKIVEEQVLDIIGSLTSFGEIERIGVTGQMHGILYVDNQGAAVSPLYTWQDGSGNCIFQSGLTYSEYIEEKTEYSVASGYGCVTHFYLQHTGGVPEEAVYLCTIGDYIAMRLTNSGIPLMHSSNAASLGLYDVESNCFDVDSMNRLGIDVSFFPPVEKGYAVAGRTSEGVLVSIAIGDNQASFLGSVDDFEKDVLINLGTGGQISCYTKSYISSNEYEVRPFMEDSYLMVASSLCGGRAYAALEKFFRETLAMCGVEVNSVYDYMSSLMDQKQFNIENPLAVNTLFCGTRNDPELRGDISGIGLSNFTPQHLIHGFMEGMARELYPAYEAFKRVKDFSMDWTGDGSVSSHKSFQGVKEFSRIVASGNAVRKNKHLRGVLQEVYGLPVVVADVPEEAAYGAALCAASSD